MTLNIICVSKAAIGVSSDFRLTKITSGKENIYVDYDTQKIYLASTFSWCAYVQFCGLAKIGRFDTSSWINSVTSNVKNGESVVELVNRLRSIPIKENKYELTITVVGFDKGHPFAYMVSNIENINSNCRRTDVGDFEISTRDIASGIAFCTGRPDLVRKNELLELKSLLARRPDHRKLHSLIARINVRAARRGGDDSGVSEAVMTGHLDLNGRGEIIPHNVNEGGEYMPPFIKSLNSDANIEIIPKLYDDGSPMPIRLVGMTVTAHGDGKTLVAALRNADRPVTKDETKNPTGNVQVFWKVAEKSSGGGLQTITLHRD